MAQQAKTNLVKMGQIFPRQGPDIRTYGYQTGPVVCGAFGCQKTHPHQLHHAFALQGNARPPMEDQTFVEEFMGRFEGQAVVARSVSELASLSDKIDFVQITESDRKQSFPHQC